MVRFSKSSWVLLGGIGTLWYAVLVMLIVADNDYPGSAALRDYKSMIGMVFLVFTACLIQVYFLKRQKDEDDD
ncbi:MAG: hypothetical protein ABIN91_00925 [Mucilaginibacter sp.]|uniref:hypothetical protein n=1 Tax=Mucilaginibacter sp. TaxID=1882438 RepID=UPI00326470FA